MKKGQLKTGVIVFGAILLFALVVFSAPPQGFATDVTLNSSNSSSIEFAHDGSNLTCFSNYSVSDGNVSIFNWFNNGTNDPYQILNTPFEQNGSASAIAKDYSIFGKSGVMLGGTVQELGGSGKCKVGGCISFDGTDDRVSFPNVFSFSSFSISYWINAPIQPTNSSDRYVIHFGPSGGNYRPLLYSRVNGTHVQFLVLGSSGSFITPYILPTNQWHHMVYTHNDGNGYTTLHANGVQLQSSIMTITDASNEYLTFGRIRGGASNYFAGLLDEVKVYNHVLSNQSIKSLYDDENNNKPYRTIASDDTTAGEEWICQVTPNDNSTDGTTVNSSGVLIISGDPSTGDSCTPPSIDNNWNIYYEDDCVLDTFTNLGTGDLILQGGSGTFTQRASIIASSKSNTCNTPPCSYNLYPTTTFTGA